MSTGDCRAEAPPAPEASGPDGHPLRCRPVPPQVSEQWAVAVGQTLSQPHPPTPDLDFATRRLRPRCHEMTSRPPARCGGGVVQLADRRRREHSAHAR